MRPTALVGVCLPLIWPVVSPASSAPAGPNGATEEAMLRAIYSEALVHGNAYAHLQALVANFPGRLSGSQALEGAVGWATETLTALKVDRVYTQDVMVPHWERGAPESVFLLDGSGTPALSACALGGSGPTPKEGLLAEVVEVQSLDELAALGRAKIEGRIVFFNRPMDPTFVSTGAAYGAAVDQRTRGPAAAARLGAAGALVRSLTLRHDDVPHTGVTVFAPEQPRIPAAALSLVAADRLGAAVVEARRNGTSIRVGMKINAQTLPDAPSHNVIGEIRGREAPDEVIVVGAHLDSWDIAPGAHDGGAGVVQSIEVLRIFRALGLEPRHTIRCVLFVNEENGTAGGREYARRAAAAGEKHRFALESDAGGFEPRAFNLTSPAHDAATRAARWLPVFRRFGIMDMRDGDGGADVTPLGAQGVPVGELIPDSQRYFDLHHTREDTIDKVNPRELQLGAAALASLVWLVDTQGL